MIPAHFPEWKQKVCPLCDIVLFYCSTTLVTQFECLAVFHPMYYNFCFFVFFERVRVCGG